MAEGESVEVTVTLSADPERDVTVGISATGQDGATEQDETDPDYSGVPPSVTFTDGGELSQTFTITAVNDTVDDDDESILLGFGNVPPGVTRGTGVTVTIEDDDVPDVVVSFAAASYDVDEGASVRVTVKLDKDPERQVVIPITTSDQGATPVLDYSGVPTSVTFESGDTEKVISFGATQDTLDDDGESVVIGFGSPLPSQVSRGTPRSTTVTIVDDDNPNVTVNFEETSYDVAEGDAVDVYVTLSGDPERSVTIPITATGQGGATSNDYAIDPPALTFESGEMSKLLTFSAAHDDLDDDGESVKLVDRQRRGRHPGRQERGHGHHRGQPGRRARGQGQLRAELVHGRRGRHGGGHAHAQPRPRTRGRDPDREDERAERQRRGLRPAAHDGEVRERRDRADAHVHTGGRRHR